MKKKILNLGILAFAAALVAGCSDWTEAEPNNYFEPRPAESPPNPAIR